MPRFQYTVISTDGKKLNGTIDSANENAARKDLNSLGFSVMHMQQVDESSADQQEGTVTFEFEAFDKKGKKVIGTIAAKDQYSAFKRLKIEYEFTVLNIVKGALSSYEKQQAKQEGVKELESRLSQESDTNAKKDVIPDSSLQAQAEQEANITSKEAQILKDQIDFALQKVTELVNKYGQELENDSRTKINQQVNKLLRIKSSTNLSYVKQSCEELLKTVQEEESLMINKENDFVKSKLTFEVNKALDDLHRGKAKKSWREEKIEELEHFLSHNELTPNTPLFLKLKIKAANWILSIIKESDEVRALRKKDFLLNEQIEDYKKMVKREDNPQIREQLKKTIESLSDKHKLLKNQIKVRKKWEREQYLAGLPETFLTTLLKEFYTFTGWLLAFYLIYYFLSIYISTKNFGFAEIPNNFDVYDSRFFKYILVVLFLAHSSISLKVNFFKNSASANMVLFPSVLVIMLMIMFNL